MRLQELAWWQQPLEEGVWRNTALLGRSGGVLVEETAFELGFRNGLWEVRSVLKHQDKQREKGG